MFNSYQLQFLLNELSMVIPKNDQEEQLITDLKTAPRNLQSVDTDISGSLEIECGRALLDSRGYDLRNRRAAAVGLKESEPDSAILPAIVTLTYASMSSTSPWQEP
ncbi:hypothetical protein SZ00_05053 [Rhodococcus sp. AD45]|nr:hypothetical protein SZ00_05053 [Rhodococcus sp. AD45]